MANGSILTTLGRKIILNRAYKETPDYTIPGQFKIGIEGDTPSIADTDLDRVVPISDGTILDDGTVNFTASYSGSASTNNTTTYKEGAGTTDATAQNLLSEVPSDSGTKNWYITSLTNTAGTGEVGFWLYIKDDTTYDKLLSSGTAVEMRIGSGTATNYYYRNWTRSQLSGTGWNWLTSGTGVQNIGMVGSVTGALSHFLIEVITNNATDTFSTGDVIYDLFRQWDESDTKKNWISGSYPTLNESTLTVEMRGELTVAEANGFDIDSFGEFNTDWPAKMSGEDIFANESKSSTDKFTFIIQNRLN